MTLPRVVKQPVGVGEALFSVPPYWGLGHAHGFSPMAARCPLRPQRLLSLLAFGSLAPSRALDVFAHVGRGLDALCTNPTSTMSCSFKGDGVYPLHGCSRKRMRLKHGRHGGCGTDALVIERSWSTLHGCSSNRMQLGHGSGTDDLVTVWSCSSDAAVVWAWMLW